MSKFHPSPLLISHRVIHLYLPHSWLHFPIWPLRTLSLILVHFPFLLLLAAPGTRTLWGPAPFCLLALIARLPWLSLWKALGYSFQKSLRSASASGKGGSTPFKGQLRNKAAVKLRLMGTPWPQPLPMTGTKPTAGALALGLPFWQLPKPRFEPAKSVCPWAMPYGSRHVTQSMPMEIKNGKRVAH